MKDQTEQVLVSLLERAVQGIDEAVAFSQAQIPDVVEQLLLWHGVKSAVLTLVGVALIVACGALVLWVMTRKPVPLEDREEGKYSFSTHRSTLFHDDRGRMTGSQCMLFFLIFPVGMGMCMISLDWLQILIAPKLYLLEYAAKLVG